MPILVPCRGNVYKVNPSGEGGGSQGFFSIDGLTGLKGPGEALLINSAMPQENDVVLPVITLENTRILYSFGSNFGDMVVSGVILLGKAGGNGGQALKMLIDFFKENRVSQKQEATKVTGPGVGWEVFLTGLAVSEADAVTHMQPFQLSGKIAEPQ